MKYKILFTVIMSVVLGSATVFAQQISVQAAIGQQEAVVGEPVDFQIQITGSSSPSQPDLSELKKDFIVKSNGGVPQRSSSITIINGKMTKVVKNDYIFSFTLSPERIGTFIIPSIAVNIDGRQYRTQRLSLSVKKVTETDDFKLRLSLSKKRCYVGEPIILNIVWYLNKDVRGFDISLPVLDNPDLFFADKHVDTSGGGYINVPLGGKNVVAKQAQGRLDGKEYTTISFSKVIIPKKSGMVKIAPAQIVCESLIGYKARGSSDPFFGDFSPFGSRRRAVYKRVVIPSNGLEFEVLPLPTEGRPKNFSGHVGEYRIATDATPVDVSVGDPITLRIQLSGPEYVDHVSAPRLTEQKNLICNFKVPAEMGDGIITRGCKLFTQTIRALNSDVHEIPAIELPYFNTKNGKYAIAKSTPIPLKVKFSRVVTVADAEGLTVAAANGSAVESWSRGIAHNYDGPDLLKNNRYGLGSKAYPKLALVLIVFPPIVYLLVFIVLLVSRYRENNSPAILAHKAFSKLVQSLKAAENNKEKNDSYLLLSSLQNYLSNKLGLSHGVLTYGDVADILNSRGVDSEILKELKDLFAECEAGHFGGIVVGDNSTALSDRIIDVAQKLEKVLK